jgi:hypothetical protein
MNFFKKWFQKMSREAWENSGLPSTKTQTITSDSISEDKLQSSGTNFSVYKADGGFVVETSWRDKHHDRHNSLYLITEDQNFGERISQILTYEAIKR